MLAQGATQLRVANALKINKRTLTRWLGETEFKTKVAELRGHRFRQAEELVKSGNEIQLQDLIPKALAALKELLENSDTRSSDRLKAVQLIGSWAGFDKIQEHSQKPRAQPIRDPAARKAEIERLIERRQQLLEKLETVRTDPENEPNSKDHV